MAGQLVVRAFDGVDAAAGMLETVRELEKRGLLEIEDVVVASRPAGSERILTGSASSGSMPTMVSQRTPEVEVTQSAARRGRSAALGGGIGLLAGWLLGGPLGGAAVGAVLGALRDRGISDRFVNDLSQELRPDTSAIFLLVKRAETEQVLEALRPYQGRVVHTTIDPTVEQALRKALEREG